ncbi:MAG: hypothetical protein Q9165_003618 [Trypethelium subeluteriae]
MPANPSGESQSASTSGSDSNAQERPPSLAEQASYRILWEKAMDPESKFVHYDRGAALLLSWDDTCDELKTKEEVDQLAGVFEDAYGLEVRREELSHEDRPQSQINAYLANFVKECESRKEHVLLIIYYAGHGWSDSSEVDETVESRETPRRRKRLKLIANTSHKFAAELDRNSVMWESAEHIIHNADADVLLIFDCCNAGLIRRSGKHKRFEALAACTEDARTRIPGKHSFTSALIWALRKQHQQKTRFFPTSTLLRIITEAPDFPKDQAPLLVKRVSSPDDISLNPLYPDCTSPSLPRPEQSQDANRVAKPNYLDLRLHCETLTDGEISEIARALRKTMLEGALNTQKIEFLGKNSIWKDAYWDPVSKAGARFLKLGRENAQRRIKSETESTLMTEHLNVAPVTPDVSGSAEPDDSSSA